TVADEPAGLLAARQLRRAARQAALDARVEALSAEKRQIEAETGLLAAQRDVLAQQSQHDKQVVARLEGALQQRRRADADKAVADAQKQAQSVDPLLSDVAAANQELANERQGWIQKLAGAKQDAEQAKTRRLELDSRFKEIEKRIPKSTGLNDVIGLQLRQEKAKLPNVRSLVAKIEQRGNATIEALQSQFDLEQRARDYQQERDAIQREAVGRVPLGAAAAAAERVTADCAELLRQRDELYAGLLSDVDAYVKALGEADLEERQLADRARFWEEYVNERVLWIRSTQPIWRTDWSAVGDSAVWLLDADGWVTAAASVGAVLDRNPATLVSVALLALLLIAFARPARRYIGVLGEQAASARTTSFLPTVWTLLLTVVAAVGAPLLVWHLAFQVQDTPGIGEYPSAIAGGLAHVAMLYGAAALFGQGMRSGGLAEAHLRWPVARTRLFRRNLAWFLPAVLPLGFLLRVLTLHGNARWGYMLDRLLLIAVLVLIATFLGRVLHPTRGALAESSASVFARRRRLWWWLGILAPAALAILAAIGYHLSALELMYRLEASIGVLGLAILLYDLGMRWMLLAKRRLAIAQAKARREAAKARSAEGAEGQSEVPELPVQTVDLASVDAQSRKLLGAALLLSALGVLWVIWSEVAPALRGLDSFKLWNDINEFTSIVNGQPVNVSEPTPITLWNLLLALLAVGVTFVAATNIPGLLELAVLQRLQIHAGERAAITTLVRYAIVTIGVVIAFSSVGIGWGKIQWLVAAVSLGLGFGLQEIFANFVSGIIILFERPIRVGDIVTVGGVDGYVTRIRMRATTIVDFDRKELIVPNREFVTSQVVNWTLTDPVTRLIIPVGVAYGSDTDLAHELLMKAAKDNELILTDPTPVALFRGFGDSSLDFQLWVYLPNRDVWRQVIDGLHTAIDKAFRAAGIEIAFPQRDIHVRTVGPLQRLFEEREAMTE
ncbi:MAG: mechanosensitive ion channel, partial [Planctomycetes bacterium]|nr:mechanosensitive ion channel [Planctomycetota bacterium]